MIAKRGSGTRNVAEARRILVVDDDHDSAEILAIMLEREGHETRVAHDAQQAILLALQFRPSLAFLDIGLPGMDGYELLAALRKAPGLEGCKFIAVTGYAEVKCEPGTHVFDGHLLKPIDLAAVAQLVLEIGRPSFGGVNPVSA